MTMNNNSNNRISMQSLLLISYRFCFTKSHRADVQIVVLITCFGIIILTKYKRSQFYIEIGRTCLVWLKWNSFIAGKKGSNRGVCVCVCVCVCWIRGSLTSLHTPRTSFNYPNRQMQHRLLTVINTSIVLFCFLSYLSRFLLEKGL